MPWACWRSSSCGPTRGCRFRFLWWTAGRWGSICCIPLDGATHLLALDAIDTGAEPGTLLRFAGEEIADLPISKSVHLLGFSDLIGAMRLTGSAPAEIVVLGVQPEATGWGTQLTPTVEAALPELIESAIAQVERWRAGMPALPPAGYTERCRPARLAEAARACSDPSPAPEGFMFRIDSFDWPQACSAPGRR